MTVIDTSTKSLSPLTYNKHYTNFNDVCLYHLPQSTALLKQDFSVVTWTSRTSVLLRDWLVRIVIDQ